jgi:hypothetical protein
VTPPTYVFWHALAVEMGGSLGWRRLLLPALFFAVQAYPCPLPNPKP